MEVDPVVIWNLLWAHTGLDRFRFQLPAGVAQCVMFTTFYRTSDAIVSGCNIFAQGVDSVNQVPK